MWCPTWYAAISISYLLVLLFYAVLPESHSDWLWRLILGFGAVPALVIIAIRSRYMSESPVWAANQGNLRDAAAILRKAYNINAHVAQDALDNPTPVVKSAVEQLFPSVPWRLSAANHPRHAAVGGLFLCL